MLGMGCTKLDMQAHKFGIEMTFLDGQASGEVIVPFTQTMMANTKFGLLAFGVKYLLQCMSNSALSVSL